MTIKVTTWSPDTCGCTINYQWGTSGEVVGHQYISPTDILALYPDSHPFETTGIEHSGVVGSGLFSVALLENGTKNRIPMYVTQMSGFSSFNSGGILVFHSGSTPLVSGIILWSFTGGGANRVLHIAADGTFSASVKAQLQNIANTHFGSGVVIVT